MIMRLFSDASPWVIALLKETANRFFILASVQRHLHCLSRPTFPRPCPRAEQIERAQRLRKVEHCQDDRVWVQDSRILFARQLRHGHMSFWKHKDKEVMVVEGWIGQDRCFGTIVSSSRSSSNQCRLPLKAMRFRNRYHVLLVKI